MHTIKNVCINTGPAASLGYSLFCFGRRRIEYEAYIHPQERVVHKFVQYSVTDYCFHYNSSQKYPCASTERLRRLIAAHAHKFRAC
jgi:hypothetical protein